MIPRQATIGEPPGVTFRAAGESFVPRDIDGPLQAVLDMGGDLRLERDQATGLSRYGCTAAPDGGIVGLSSSTATPISPRAFAAAEQARAWLVAAATAATAEEALDGRIEAMRHDLLDCLGLSETEVVFSPSGTDSQLHALFVGQALLGPNLTTIVVGSDQTGSGTAHTARAEHFSDQIASGRRVRKGGRIEGFGGVTSIPVPLLGADGALRGLSDVDAEVEMAVHAAMAAGSNVLLMVMDSSKLGWRAPSDDCVAAMATQWRGRLQVVVDACQMRLGAARLKAHLRQGSMVLLTGSKFFTGPAFSGALLLPSAIAETLDAVAEVPAGVGDYSSRADWPARLGRLRAQLPLRFNVGQWLRWEAALEEIRSYRRVPLWFRRLALSHFADVASHHIGSSQVLRDLPRLTGHNDSAADEEFAVPTIFPFSIHEDGRTISGNQVTAVYRALNSDLGRSFAGSGLEAIARTRCLVGQPVILPRHGGAEAVLRISADARYVTECWSEDTPLALARLDKRLESIATVVTKIEMLVSRPELALPLTP